MRRITFAMALAGLLLAGAASAELPEPERHGPYCTPAGCHGRPASAVGHAAAFGLAVLAVAGLRRRES